MAQTRHGKTRLLEDADMNIGNQLLLQASGGSNIITSPVTNPDRLINLDADAMTAQMVTAAITAFSNPPLNQPGDSPALAGPLTAIVEFGNGARFTRAEVDIPVGKILASDSVSNATDGGSLVSVPSGTLRIYGRNDCNLVTPSADVGGTGISFGIPGGGGPGTNNIPRGFGPWWTGLGSAAQLQVVPATMKAMATYFTRPGGYRTRNTKTIWVYNGLAGNDVTVADTANDPALYFVPAFAKSVTVYRSLIVGASGLPSAAVTLTIHDQFLDSLFPMETFTVAAGAASPAFDLPDGAVAIGVKTSTANVNSLALVFEIGI